MFHQYSASRTGDLENSHHIKTGFTAIMWLSNSQEQSRQCFCNSLSGNIRYDPR